MPTILGCRSRVNTSLKFSAMAGRAGCPGRRAIEKNKPKLETRIDQARAKCENVSDQVDARLDRLRQEAEAKIAALQDQPMATKADKQKIEHRIAETRTDCDRRAASCSTPETRRRRDSRPLHRA
jgi:hypothetical protein